MADLRDGEVQVDEASNQTVYGPKGTRKRSEKSCYLLSGGSSDVYKVTINYDTGHFCQYNHSGSVCNGNMNGKARTYGHISKRDTTDPKQWCKHVKAVLSQPELLAEAQDITRQAFNPSAVAKPAKKAAKPAPVVDTVTVAEARLAELRKEEKQLRATLAKAAESEITEALTALLDKHPACLVEAILEKIAS